MTGNFEENLFAECKGEPTPVGAAPVSVSDGDLPKEAVIKPASACLSYIAVDRALQDQNAITDRELERLRQAITPARLARYLSLAGGDWRIALRLHVWNAAVAGSLLPTLHIAEIVIRNFAVKRLAAKYGKHWYRDPLLERRLGRSRLSDQLQEAYRNELQKGRKGNLSNYITDELTFGFWVNVYTKTFHLDLWKPPLHTIVAHFPRGKAITDLHEGIDFVRTFRNSVAHHKNLVTKPVVAHFERTLDVIGMICPQSAKLAKATSTFPLVWRCAPVPHDVLSTDQT